MNESPRVRIDSTETAENEQAANRRMERANRNREERERNARNRQALAELVISCTDSLRAGDSDRATAYLAEIDRRLPDGGGEDSKDWIDARRMDLAILRDLDAVDQFFWSLDLRERDMFEVEKRWQNTFGRLGARPGQQSANEIAQRVNDSAVRDRLVAALDRWLALGKWLKGSPLAEVRSALRTIDPDESRHEFRDAVLAQDAERIAELAGKFDTNRLPLWFVIAQGDNITMPPAQRRKLLKSALQQHPGHFALLMAMGGTYAFGRREGAEERVRWYQAAVAGSPRHASAHNNLGEALYYLEDLNAAIQEFRGAIRLNPNNAWARGNLGESLTLSGELEEGIAELRRAIELDPDLALVQNNLGIALWKNGDRDGAIAPFHAAIRLSPKGVWGAWPHNNLALVLLEKGEFDTAIAELKLAIERNGEIDAPHHLLGFALAEKGDFEGAIAEYKTALRINPKKNEAELKLRRIEKWRSLLPQIPKSSADSPELKSANELCELAFLCSRHFLQKHALAAALYVKAFADKPGLADDLNAGHRYEAACSASLAAAGKGADSSGLTVTERAALRKRALEWLRSDFVRYSTAAQSDSVTSQKAVAAKLQHWLSDLDLAATRSNAKRETWTAEETMAWDQFWSEVRATLAFARNSAKKSTKS